MDWDGGRRGVREGLGGEREGGVFESQARGLCVGASLAGGVPCGGERAAGRGHFARPVGRRSVPLCRRLPAAGRASSDRRSHFTLALSGSHPPGTPPPLASGAGRFQKTQRSRVTSDPALPSRRACMQAELLPRSTTQRLWEGIDGAGGCGGCEGGIDRPI